MDSKCIFFRDRRWGLSEGANNVTTGRTIFPNRAIITSSTDNTLGISKVDYFTEIVPLEIHKRICSFALDDSLVVLGRVNWILYAAVKQFVKETLGDNHDSNNFFVPFKNRFADFNKSNLGIAITYFHYAKLHLDELSCFHYSQRFGIYLYCLLQSWAEEGFMITKSDVGYELTINQEIVQLDQNNNASIYLLCQFLPRCMKSSLIPSLIQLGPALSSLTTLRKKAAESKCELSPDLQEKLELVLSIYEFRENHHFQENFLSRVISLLPDQWCKSGFHFKKSHNGDFKFLINKKYISFNENDSGFIGKVLELFRRYFFSRKIVADYLVTKKHISSVIDCFAHNKSTVTVSSTISSLLVHFYEQWHCDVDQPFWPYILAQFVDRDLIDADKALLLKNYALTKLKNISSPLQVQEQILNLLNNILIKDLVTVDLNEAIFLKDCMIEKLKNRSSSVDIELVAMGVLYHLLIKNLLKIDANDEMFLKTYLIERLRDPSSSAQLVYNFINILRDLLIDNLLQVDAVDLKFLKNYLIEKLRDFSSSLEVTYSVMDVLYNLLINNFLQLNAEEVEFLRNYVAEKCEDSLSLVEVREKLIIFEEYLRFQ